MHPCAAPCSAAEGKSNAFWQSNGLCQNLYCTKRHINAPLHAPLFHASWRRQPRQTEWERSLNKSWVAPKGGGLEKVAPRGLYDAASHTRELVKSVYFFFNVSANWTHQGVIRQGKLATCRKLNVPRWVKLKRLWVKGGDISARQAGEGRNRRAEEERRRAETLHPSEWRLILFIPWFSKGARSQHLQLLSPKGKKNNNTTTICWRELERGAHSSLEASLLFGASGQTARSNLLFIHQGFFIVFFSGVADEHIRERERESCFLQKKHEDDREDKQHTEGVEKRRGDPAEATCLAWLRIRSSETPRRRNTNCWAVRPRYTCQTQLHHRDVFKASANSALCAFLRGYDYAQYSSSAVKVQRFPVCLHSYFTPALNTNKVMLL